MNLTFRPLPTWPYPEQAPRPATYPSSYSATLGELEREVEALDGDEVIIGLVVDSAEIRLDGRLRADAKVRQPGVELSFEIPGGRRLVFHTDRHKDTPARRRPPWQDNLRAIVLGLEALRAVDRYGITSTAEQYAGFLQLEDSVEKGRRLVEEAGGVTAALKRWHPDQGGDPRAFEAVQAYRRLGEAR
jgi:hypothetical protein